MIKVIMKFLIFLVFISIMKKCKTEEENPCVGLETCEKCIQKDPRCAWCSQEDYTLRKISRCDYVWNLEDKKCMELVNPANSSITFGIDEELSKPGEHTDAAIQIKPQRITIELKPNFPKTFSVQFRQVVVYPVDVYYLVDFSHSMKEYSKEIQDLGNNIKEKIQTNFTHGSVSTYFTLGVGSFHDKDAATYYDVQPTKTPFPDIGFQSKSKLQSRTVNFLRALDDIKNDLHNSKNSSNMHSPKGTLDAIMQVIVCKDIGWRPEAKKLLVVATGNDFHYAGDGKLSGLVYPNDGKCHMDNAGYESQDYPSLSQINRKIREHNITLIFAVTDDQLDAYSNLSTRIVGAATERLSNYDHIMALVKEQYEAISSSIEMNDNSAQLAGDITLSYNSNCAGNVNQKRNVCKGLKPEDTVNFDVTIQFSHCPENYTEDDQQIIVIQPVGRSAQLEVILKMVCNCDCKNTKASERNCSGGGDFRCGICDCYKNRYGQDCECEGSENQTTLDFDGCKRWKGEKICSNRGECRCGKCICNKPEYYGSFCECDDFSCYQVNNKTCNGHGSCKCGKCRCDPGWSGPDCTCSNTTDNCFKNGVMCSGHGICECGSCKCDDTYYGQFCEDCPSCPGKCEEFSICPQCILSINDENKSEKNCETECKINTVVLVDKVEVNDTQEERVCSVQDEDDCHIFFKYRKQKDDNESTILHVRNWRECPSPPDVVAIVAGTIGSIVLAGLLLLIMWKALTYVHDRREFAKFEKERERAKWDSGQNPIYIQATSMYENPVYNVN